MSTTAFLTGSDESERPEEDEVAIVARPDELGARNKGLHFTIGRLHKPVPREALRGTFTHKTDLFCYFLLTGLTCNSLV